MNGTERTRGSAGRWNRIWALTALVVGLSAVQGSVALADGNFHVACAFSHGNNDDPIVFPREPGRAHLHHYFGSRDTDAFSTLTSMRQAGTTCAFKPDTAGYWVPALRDRSGNVVRPERVATYYWGDQATKPFPEGLKMLAGGDTRNLRRAGWTCGEGIPQSSLPKDCGRNKLKAVIIFPSCWDGQRLDSPDHRAHMSYPVAGRCGTRDYPIDVPRLTYHVRYPVTNGTGFTLSSGSAYTLHGDFWNTWDQAVQAQKVRECLNGLKKCRLGTFEVGG
jgi:hypothetical protein